MYHIDENMLSVAIMELLDCIHRQQNEEVEFDNGYFKAEEGYKYNIHEKGRNCLNVESWTEDMIGTHVIADRVLDALKIGENLIDFRTNDFVDKIDENVGLAERILFEVFKSVDLYSDKEAFKKVIQYFGRKYSRTAYLFFLKDRENYLPMKPEMFKEKFDWLNIKTDCCIGCTWEHYEEFNQIIREIQSRIQPYFKNEVSLLDAHSFVWSMHLLEQEFEYYEADFRDYSEGQICVSEEQWKALLIDIEVFPKGYLELLGKFYISEKHSATCSRLAKLEGVQTKQYISCVKMMGETVTEKLNLPYLYQDNGQRYYWPVLFYGRKLMNGLLEWQMRPELVVAFESVCQEVLRDIRDNEEQKEAEALDDTVLFHKAKVKSGKQSAGRMRTVEQKYRDPYIAEWAKRRAEGVCLLCGELAPFRDKKGRPYLESHHIEWLSEGGADSIENVIALCPNCHRKMHELKGEKEEIEDRQFLKECIEEYIKREKSI